MRILAIESSCDETAAAVVEDGVKILSNVVVSQVDIFKVYGGVIPEVAARSHLEAVLPVVEKALADAGVTREEVDAIAVTHTPGLLGSLLIGTLTARMLAILWKKPLYATHHLKSHIYANWLGGVAAPEFPLLALVISGGHTQIIYMQEHNKFEIIGTTRDDAVGECFDKVAKILGLPYPGGPSVAKCATDGNPLKYRLPHPQVEGLDFSFSGLKTAVLRAVQQELGVPISCPSYELKDKLTEQQRADFAASFQETACEILLEKLKKALVTHPEAKSLVFAGGVSANRVLREKAARGLILRSHGKRAGMTHSPFDAGDDTGSSVSFSPQIYFPEVKYTGDNAAMVGAAAYFEVMTGVEATDPYALDIMPRSAIR